MRESISDLSKYLRTLRPADVVSGLITAGVIHATGGAYLAVVFTLSFGTGLVIQARREV